MALEQLDGGNLLHLSPGPFDAHMHPRITDVITEDAFIEINGGYEGKAGLPIYTKAAILSGIVGGGAMPNELMRVYDVSHTEKTMIVPFPISNIDRVRAMQSAIQGYSNIPMAVYAGIDPEEIFSDQKRQCINYDLAEENFISVKDEVSALKLWGDESTGGFNVQTWFIPPLATRWHKHNPEKPIILHLEDENVGTVLQAIAKLEQGKNIPIHIAHVSSRQELESVIDAKKAGMNVTCEVTVHHLFLDASVRKQIGGYGCMKPSLKPQEDVDFLWANLRYIDILASDCAPHRKSDKESENPAFGVTNHTVMLPLLMGAVGAGRITTDEIYQKFCINPRKRFNLPIEDGSWIEYDISSYTTAQDLEKHIDPRYGHNPFTKIPTKIPMLGRVMDAKAGVSQISNEIKPSYTHLLRPKNLGSIAIKNQGEEL